MKHGKLRVLRGKNLDGEKFFLAAIMREAPKRDELLEPNRNLNVVVLSKRDVETLTNILGKLSRGLRTSHLPRELRKYQAKFGKFLDRSKK
jgi:acetolactate synthase regulatory subunit